MRWQRRRGKSHSCRAMFGMKNMLRRWGLQGAGTMIYERPDPKNPCLKPCSAEKWAVASTHLRGLKRHLAGVGGGAAGCGHGDLRSAGPQEPCQHGAARNHAHAHGGLWRGRPAHAVPGLRRARPRLLRRVRGFPHAVVHMQKACAPLLGRDAYLCCCVALAGASASLLRLSADVSGYAFPTSCDRRRW